MEVGKNDWNIFMKFCKIDIVNYEYSITNAM